MLTLLFLAPLILNPNYDALITDLSGSSETAKTAHDKLVAAGVDAFPSLLKRIDDETVIDNGAFQEAAEKIVDGQLVPARTHIGRVAFLIIQYQIEGAWPKGFRRHHAITERNVAAWLAKHQGLSLDELRIRALADSMDSLSREIAETGLHRHQVLNLRFFRTRLDKILARIGDEQ